MAKIKFIPTISANPSGKIPPAPSRGKPSLADMASGHTPSVAPNARPAGEVNPTSIDATLVRVKELASGVIPPDPEK